MFRRARTPSSDNQALPERTQRAVIFALAMVLALDGADRSALGALAPAIKHQFGVGNVDIGLLAAAFSIVGGLATVPVGILTDRMRRVTLLVVSIVIWSMAMGVVAAAASFGVLFAGRVALGVVTATGGPPVTSIVGDLCPPGERGRVLAWVKSGELIGAGAGFLLAGALISVFSWRSVFIVLGAFGFLLAFRVSRVPEPPRGGEGRAEDGSTRSLDEPTPLREIIEEEGIEPRRSLVLYGDQSERPLRWAVRYILQVRTVVYIIVASAVVDFFFAGLQVFGVVFMTRQYGVTASTASLLIPAIGVGGFAGILLGGRLGDHLVKRGILTGRLKVGAFSYLAVSVMFVPVFVTKSLAVGVPFLVVASALIAAPVAPLEAARLDVLHPQLRGRAESARMVARIAAQASAPLLLGILSEDVAGGGASGLRTMFLALLPLLAVGSVLLLLAQRRYPRGVASVQESTVAD